MSEIKNAILETHCAVQRVRSISASSRPARDVSAAAGQLARAASRLEASVLAVAAPQLDPVDAVRMVVERRSAPEPTGNRWLPR